MDKYDDTIKFEKKYTRRIICRGIIREIEEVEIFTLKEQKERFKSILTFCNSMIKSPFEVYQLIVSPHYVSDNGYLTGVSKDLNRFGNYFNLSY